MRDWKGNEKAKGEWPQNRGKRQDVGEKENVGPYKKFNATEKGHRPHPGEQKIEGGGRETLECCYCICSKDHHKKDFTLYQGGRPQIYSAQEVQIVGYVGKRFSQIYETLDNRQADHEVSIIEMEGKRCDRVFSILIDPRGSYTYVIPDLVDKCGFNKEVHAESWLV